MGDYLKYLGKVLETPEEVRYSNRSREVLLFYRFFDNIENGKYIAVVVREFDGSVLTAYLTDKIKAGERYEKN